jgi:hypothetical protein
MSEEYTNMVDNTLKKEDFSIYENAFLEIVQVNINHKQDIENIIRTYKTAPDNQKYYVPIASIIYMIGKNELERLRKYEELLKDINILHLVGYLGYIMVSDQVTSFSEEAVTFPITNTCKDIFETYILNSHENPNIIIAITIMRKSMRI